MTGTPVSQAASSGWFAPAWLPPGGHGNELAAASWAPVADLDAAIIDTVLQVLGAARVPAYAAPASRPVRPLLPHTPVRGAVWRLWVASTSYAQAEHVLLTCLPPLLQAIDKPVYPVPHRRLRRRPGRG